MQDGRDDLMAIIVGLPNMQEEFNVINRRWKYASSGLYRLFCNSLYFRQFDCFHFIRRHVDLERVMQLADYSKWTLLHYGIRSNAPIDIIDDLLRCRNINLSAEDDHGKTPLQYANHELRRYIDFRMATYSVTANKLHL